MRKRWKQAMLASWAGGANVMAYTNKVIALSPIAYWPLADASGTTATDESGNGRNGTYTGVTLGVSGIGDGRTAASFDGATTVVNIFSAGYAAALGTPSAGTLSAWLKVSAAGVWTDSTLRRPFFTGVDGGNRIYIQRETANNQMSLFYLAGGTSKFVTITGLSTIAFFHVAITWDKAADQVKVFLNGSQFGTTQTGLGAWAGTVVNGTIGAGTATPTQVWNGFMAHIALWTTALSPAQIASLATVP